MNTRGGPKGRYKLRTQKWEIKAAVKAEARELLRNRSEKQSRCLDAALQEGNNLEQTGLLARRDLLSYRLLCTGSASNSIPFLINSGNDSIDAGVFTGIGTVFKS